jgi:hypothetical protein
VAREFGAAGGSGGEDELHGGLMAARILQTERGDSLCLGSAEEATGPPRKTGRPISFSQVAHGN